MGDGNCNLRWSAAVSVVQEFMWWAGVRSWTGSWQSPPPKERLPDAPKHRTIQEGGGAEVEPGEGQRARFMWGRRDRSPPGQSRRDRSPPGRSRRDRNPPGRSRQDRGRRDRAGDLHDGAGAHQCGADGAGALQGGQRPMAEDWDLGETETERACMVSRTEAGNSGSHGRSRASGSHDGSGDSVGHGGSGVSVSNGG